MDQSTASCSSSPSVFGGGMAGSSSSGAGGGFFMGDSNAGNAGGSQPAHQPQHQQQDEPEVCLVCNDVATGYHYGTPSCNGCKTFFRRTVMKKQVFQCQYDGNCPVDKSVRCACRHCRFKKCLAVGMNKDAIQQNRDPIGYTKRTRRYPLVKQQHALLGSAFNSGGCSTSGTPFPDSSSTPFPGSSSMAMAGCSSTSSASFMNSLGPGPSSSRASQHHQQPQPPMSAEQVQEDLLLQRLINVENILLTIRQNANFLNSKVTMQKSLNDLVLNRSVFEDPELLKQMSSEHFQMPNVLRRAEQQDYLYWHERDWFIMIEWAKCVPVYQELSISDKLALLRHSAITYPSLIQCFYTPDVGPDTIVFPNGAFFDRTLDPNKPTGFQRKNFKMLDNLLNPIRKMQIDQNEFAGAKAVFFLNPDSDADDLSTEAKGRIAVARSAITNALYRYMVQKRGTEEAADKFGKLLLLGTAIATMSCEMKEAVVVADFFDQIRFSGFARQLLLAKDEDDLSAVTTATESPQASAQEQQQQPQHQPQQPQNILPQQSQGILHQQQQNILGQHQSQLHVNMHQQQQQQLHNFATHHQAQQQLHLPQSQYQQQLFSTLPANNINAVANNAAVTLAMLGGLNAQMQQFQQQQQQHHQPQQHGLPSLDFIDLTRGQQQFGMLNEQQEREKQLQQQRQQMIQQIMAAGQQRFQLQQLQQMSHLGQTNLGQQMQTQLGQTQLGQTQLQHQQQSQFHQQQQQTQLGQTQLCQKELGQTQLGPQSAQTTVLPPQDHPLTPGGQQPQQSPSAPSLQSFTNTSPPSLINLT